MRKNKKRDTGLLGHDFYDYQSMSYNPLCDRMVTNFAQFELFKEFDLIYFEYSSAEVTAKLSSGPCSGSSLAATVFENSSYTWVNDCTETMVDHQHFAAHAILHPSCRRLSSWCIEYSQNLIDFLQRRTNASNQP